jgi:hypothetical protein
VWSKKNRALAKRLDQKRMNDVNRGVDSTSMRDYGLVL